MPKTRLPSAAVYTPPELLASGYGGYPQYDGAACDAWCLGICLFCARPDAAALPARARRRLAAACACHAVQAKEGEAQLRDTGPEVQHHRSGLAESRSRMCMSCTAGKRG